MSDQTPPTTIPALPSDLAHGTWIIERITVSGISNADITKLDSAGLPAINVRVQPATYADPKKREGGKSDGVWELRWRFRWPAAPTFSDDLIFALGGVWSWQREVYEHAGQLGWTLGTERSSAVQTLGLRWAMHNAGGTR